MELGPAGGFETTGGAAFGVTGGTAFFDSGRGGSCTGGGAAGGGGGGISTPCCPAAAWPGEGRHHRRGTAHAGGRFTGKRLRIGCTWVGELSRQGRTWRRFRPRGRNLLPRLQTATQLFRGLQRAGGIADGRCSRGRPIGRRSAHHRRGWRRGFQSLRIQIVDLLLHLVGIWEGLLQLRQFALRLVELLAIDELVRLSQSLFQALVALAGLALLLRLGQQALGLIVGGRAAAPAGIRAPRRCSHPAASPSVRS